MIHVDRSKRKKVVTGKGTDILIEITMALSTLAEDLTEKGKGTYIDNAYWLLNEIKKTLGYTDAILRESR